MRFNIIQVCFSIIIFNIFAISSAFANTEQTQNVSCSLTCDNTNYVKPGNGKTQERNTLPIRKDVDLLLKESFNHLKGSKNLESDPKKALSVLEKHKLKDLNIHELAQIHFLKGYTYKALGKYKKSLDEFLLTINSSPNIHAYIELQALRSIWFDYASLNKNNQAIIRQWAALTDKITYEEYISISKIYEAERNLPQAIANLARGLELADANTGFSLWDYAHLSKLYTLNNQPAEADNIQNNFIKKYSKNEIINPIVTVAHEYPSSAITRRIQGYCIVTFDITPTGSTTNIHIEQGDCKTFKGEVTDVFSASSMKAAKKFKFNPTIENGKAIEVKNVVYKFSYKMAR